MGRTTGSTQQSVMFLFLFVCHAFEIKMFAKTNTIKQCTFEKNYGDIAQGKVSSYAPMGLFEFFYHQGQIDSKVTNFDDFGAVSPHFYTHNGKLWHEGAELGPLHHAKFCFKKSLKGFVAYE